MKKRSLILSFCWDIITHFYKDFLIKIKVKVELECVNKNLKDYKKQNYGLLK
jgi:hypothetical protein